MSLNRTAYLGNLSCQKNLIKLGFEGFEAKPDYDFSETENPRAREMWNRAIIIIMHLENQPNLVHYTIPYHKS